MPIGVMGGFAKTVLTLALLGALASWFCGAIYFARALPGAPQGPRSPTRWLLIAGWPFAMGRIRTAPPSLTGAVNRAIVAFLVLMTVAAATISLATNFNRITK